MVTNHYRWDFIGLSTDDKPTSETSEKVVNGSTFYCSDTSKLYVYCDGTWYERKPLGGGGGGTTYTAGDGIDITSDVISVDTTTIQEKLTAGDGITILNNVISAVGGGGKLVKELSTSDYNWNLTTHSAENPNCVALWLLDDGFYRAKDEDTVVKLYDSTAASASAGGGTVVCSLTSGTEKKFVYIKGYKTYFNATTISTGANSTSEVQYLRSSDIKNNLTTSATGSALDAHQVKELKDLIDALDQRVTALGG